MTDNKLRMAWFIYLYLQPLSIHLQRMSPYPQRLERIELYGTVQIDAKTDF